MRSVNRGSHKRIGPSVSGCSRRGPLGRDHHRPSTPTLVAHSTRIFLNTGGTQPKKAVTINRILPVKKLVGSQRVATARLFERYQSASNCRNNYSLAPNHPALCSRRRQIGTCQRTAVGADYTINSRTMGTRHPTLARWAQNASNRSLFGSEPDAGPSLLPSLGCS
jgi:hypothetical protein